jgi:hypothetical protein
MLAELPGSLNAYFSDNGFFAGSVAEVRAAWRVIRTKGADIGYDVNVAEAKLLCSEPTRARLLGELDDAMNIDVLDAIDTEFNNLEKVSGLNVVGCPVGDDAFIDSDLGNKRLDLGDLLTKVENLEDPQTSFFLLLRSASSCRVTHLSRTLGARANDFLDWFDDRVIRSLTRIVSRDELSEHAVRNARLRLSLGGLGLRAAR